MTFEEDISSGLDKLEYYCALHDLKTEDVLWANHKEKDALTAGDAIFLPEDQADMLAIWQHIGGWNVKTLTPVTTEPKKAPEVRKVEPVQASQSEASPPPVPAQPVRAQPIKIINNTDTPAKVLAQTAKPDAILTSKPKPKAELAKVADPIIVLSPNGDPLTGPVRLVLSGDKVEIVKLPPEAAPKTPTMDMSFGPIEQYLPKYNTLARPTKIINNNIFTMNLNGKMLWPVDGKISSPFGRLRGKHKHEGIDIPMPAGTPIRAAKNGTVIRTGNNSTIGFRGYGNFVMLDHGGNVRTFYAHCSKVAVVEGQKIMQGQIIAYVGNTGRSTANHLHFEVRINDQKVNPIPYLAGNTHLASTK